MYSGPNRLKIGIRQDLDRMGRVEAIETDLTAEQDTPCGGQCVRDCARAFFWLCREHNDGIAV